MKRMLSMILVLALLVSMSTGFVFGASEKAVATSMKIAGIDGTVKVTNANGKEVKAKVDTRLSSGYTLETGNASYCFINLDDSKAVKLGQSTKVTVEKSSKKIELNVKSGEIFFDVAKKLSGDESLNIKTSNMTTGIRGTRGSVIVISKTRTNVILVEGRVQIDTPAGSIKLEAGNKAEISGSFEGTGAAEASSQIVAIDVAHDLDAFTLRANLEIEAIDNGMSVSEAMAAPSTELAQVAAPAEEVVKAESANLDGNVAGDEKEDAAQREKTEAAIKTETENNLKAMDDAVKGKETTTVVGEDGLELEEIGDDEIGEVFGSAPSEEVQVDQVFGKAETANSKGVSAENTSFEKEVTAEATPEETQPEETATRNSSGGRSSGGGGTPSATVSVTGYTGTYDGVEHAAVASSTIPDGYVLYVYLIEDAYSADRVNNGIASAKSAYVPDGATSYLRAMDDAIIALDVVDRASEAKVTGVIESGSYGYYVLAPTQDGQDYTGTFTVTINKAVPNVTWVSKADLTEITSGLEVAYANRNRIIPTIVGSEVINEWTYYNATGEAIATNSTLDAYLASNSFEAGTYTVKATALAYEDDYTLDDASLTFTWTVAAAAGGGAAYGADLTGDVTYSYTAAAGWEKTLTGGSANAITAADMLSEIASNGFDNITITSDTTVRVEEELVLPTDLSGRNIFFDGSGTINLTKGLSFGATGNATTVTNKGSLTTSGYDLVIPSSVTFINSKLLQVGSIVVSGALKHNDNNSETHAQSTLTINEGGTFYSDAVSARLELATYSYGGSYAVINNGTYTQKGGILKINNASVYAVTGSSAASFEGINNGPSIENAYIVKKGEGASVASADCLDYVLESYVQKADDTAVFTRPASGRISGANVSNFDGDRCTVLEFGII